MDDDEQFKHKIYLFSIKLNELKNELFDLVIKNENHKRQKILEKAYDYMVKVEEKIEKSYFKD